MNKFNRSMRYELYNIKNYNLGLMAISLLILIGLYFTNIYFMENSSALGQVKHIGNGINTVRALSIVQTLMLGMGLMLIVGSFSFIYRSLPINISMSITRKEFFKTILFQNIVTSLVLSTFMGILLKLEPFFIGRIIDTRPSYVYLSELGNIDILQSNILLVILNIFLVFLAVSAMWTTISLLMYIFKAYVFLLIIGFNIILENSYIKNNRIIIYIRQFLDFISIDTLIDGSENLIGLFGSSIVFIIIFYGVIYFSLRFVQVRGE